MRCLPKSSRTVATLLWAGLLAMLSSPLWASALWTSPASAQPRPVIERIEPASGPAGAQVQIIGRHIHPHSRIFLGQTELQVQRRLPGRWTVVVPAGAASGQIVIQTHRGGFPGPYFRVTPGRPVPVIERLEPAAGPPGSQVTIHGHNFSPRIADNSVRLGHVPVVVRSASPQALVVIVPNGTSSAPFVVSVTQAGETQSEAFTMTAGLSVSDFQPRAGPPGADITIVGSGFSPVARQNRVYIQNRRLRVLSASVNQLLVRLPRRAVSGPLLVDVLHGGRVSTSDAFRVQLAPTVARVEPAASSPGRIVTLFGRNFGSDPRAVSVTLAGRPVLLRRVLPDRIEVEIPAGAAAGRFAVSVHGVGPVLAPMDFFVMVPVAVGSFTPRTGGPGTEVRIIGQGFSPNPADNHVVLGNSAAQVVAASGTELRVRVPSGSSGPLLVRVAGNGEARSQLPFIVTQPPFIAGFSPASGGPGTEVTLQGANFGTNLSLVTVRLSGLPMQVRSLTNDRIVALVPPQARTGRLTVAVRLQGTGAASTDFRVMSPFSVAGLTPASAFVGSTLTIRGQGFVQGTRVQFPGVRRRQVAQVISAEEMRVVVPRRTGAGPLTVQLPDGRTLHTPPMSIGSAPEGVAISQVLPTCYRPGCRVTLRGHGFSTSVRFNRVYFGDRSVRVERASATEITVSLPAAPGTAPFRVDVRGGGEASSPPFTIIQ